MALVNDEFYNAIYLSIKIAHPVKGCFTLLFLVKPPDRLETRDRLKELSFTFVSLSFQNTLSFHGRPSSTPTGVFLRPEVREGVRQPEVHVLNLAERILGAHLCNHILDHICRGPNLKRTNRHQGKLRLLYPQHPPTQDGTLGLVQIKGLDNPTYRASL